MEHEWLAEQLEAGRSIESIAREVGRHPSTVSYWAKHHGLASSHAERHAARGGLSREDLEALVEVGMTIRQIARELDRSPTTIRHWLDRFEVRTHVARQLRRDGSTAAEVERDCPTHGWTTYRRIGSQTQYRCVKCVVAAVTHRRRVVTEILIGEFGGRCSVCGYDRNPRALVFHHLDPATKLFTLRNGDSRSLARMRAEAAKCVLLCANCHAEVESGTLELPVPSGERDTSGVAQHRDPG
jgi:transposase-like protein